jgi:hypothetical protein
MPVTWSQLVLGDAFLQANLIKGYRYLDLSGVIMNWLDDRFASQQVGLRGLVSVQPRDEGDYLMEMRVGSDQIWLHYGLRTPWNLIRKEAPGIVKRVADTFEVSGYSRRGFRVQLVMPVESASRVNARLATVHNPLAVNWDSLGSLKDPILMGTVTIEDARASSQAPSSAPRPDSTRSSRDTVRVIIRTGKAGGLQETDATSVELNTEGESAGERQAGQRDARQADAGAAGADALQDVVVIDVDYYDDARTTELDIGPFLNRAVKYIEDKIPPFVERLLGEDIRD